MHLHFNIFFINLQFHVKKTYPLSVTKHTMPLDIEAKRRIRRLKRPVHVWYVSTGCI